MAISYGKMDACFQTVLIISIALYQIDGRVVKGRDGLSGAPSVGEPWPMPQKYQTTDVIFQVDAKTFQFMTTGQDCDLLKPAYARYVNYTFGGYTQGNGRSRSLPSKPSTAGSVQRLEVTVQSCGTKYPEFESKEDYNLTIASGVAKLQATEVWGALRGLETFSQIVYRNKTGEFLVPQTSIEDFPRFPHRGFLLDTGRHFISLRNIFRSLDALAFNKMNVFHWHIVDNPSFPFVSKTFPELSEKGAYDPVTHIYTPQDVADVIEYARQRGIRVIPEFDSPGHSLSWGNSHLEVLTKCFRDGKPSGQWGPVDVSAPAAYDFLNKLYAEIAQVFPDKYVHLGGDEVDFSCWKSSPNISAFMTANKITDYAGVEAYYLQKVVGIAQKINKQYIVWQEVLDNGVKVNNATIVAVWKGNWQKEVAWITSLGYTTLFSSEDCWYFDLIHYGQDWEYAYKCEPLAFEGTAAQKALIIGGEASLWTEYVDNSNVISRAWPRASTVAERLWSAASVNDVDDATRRIEEQRCRMIRRGLPAEPIIGPGFCGVEY